MSIRNINKVLKQADAIDWREGKLAYMRYREVCWRLANHYGYPFEKVVSVVAATSPNSDYRSNIRSATTILQAHAEGVPVEQINIASYGHCKDRAYGYLNGVSFADTVKGKKIWSFYYNIMNPANPYPVTIDGHAVNMWKNQVNRLNADEARITGKQYEVIAEDFRKVAKQHKLLPNQLQAITWFTWKRINRIIFDAQGDLFYGAEDYWKTLITIEEIRVFKYGNSSNHNLSGNHTASDADAGQIETGSRNEAASYKRPVQAELFT